MSEFSITDPAATRDFLELALAGCSEAERLIVTRFSLILDSEVRRHGLWRLLKAYENSEDIVNRVWVRVLKKGSLAAFEDRGRGSLQSYLRPFLDHTMGDLYRHYRALKRQGGSAKEFSSAVEDTSGDPMYRVPDQKEPTPTSNVRASEMIEKCKQVLNPREWRIWRMAELDGLTDAEICTIFEISKSRVRGIVCEARKKIANALEK